MCWHRDKDKVHIEISGYLSNIFYIYSSVCYYRNFQDHILNISLTEQASHWCLWGGFELIQWPDWQVTLVCQWSNKATSRQTSSYHSGCILCCPALCSPCSCLSVWSPFSFLSANAHKSLFFFSQFAFMYFLNGVCNGQTTSEASEYQRWKTDKKVT